MSLRPLPVRSKTNAAAVGGAGFQALDDCHRQTLAALAKLDTVLARLDGSVDAETRVLAGDVVRHFSTTARRHHEDEERHVFAKLAASGDPTLARAVSRLQHDHHWLAADWMELLPHLDAIACGQSWYDVDLLREGGAVFAALSRDHIALEESCIYPQVRQHLQPHELAAMEPKPGCGSADH